MFIWPVDYLSSSLLYKAKIAPEKIEHVINISKNRVLSNKLFTSIKFMSVPKAWKRIRKFHGPGPILALLFSGSKIGEMFLIV